MKYTKVYNNILDVVGAECVMRHHDCDVCPLGAAEAENCGLWAQESPENTRLAAALLGFEVAE